MGLHLRWPLVIQWWRDAHHCGRRSGVSERPHRLRSEASKDSEIDASTPLIGVQRLGPGARMETWIDYLHGKESPALLAFSSMLRRKHVKLSSGALHTAPVHPPATFLPVVLRQGVRPCGSAPFSTPPEQRGWTPCRRATNSRFLPQRQYRCSVA